MKAPDFTLEEVKEYLRSEVHYIEAVGVFKNAILDHIEQLEAERDAAVSELVGTCQVCRWEETAKCASCHFCEDAWNVHESNWEWRGVQKEG